MKELVNNAKRRLGIPGRRALILDAGQRASISDAELDELQRNRTVARWLEKGVLTVVEGDVAVPPPKRELPKTGVKVKPGDEREPQTLPDGVTGTGVETHHAGGGWYEVYVNGFKVTDAKVRKDEAETLAAEYE